MRLGVDLGPLWVSTGGHCHCRRVRDRGTWFGAALVLGAVVLIGLGGWREVLGWLLLAAPLAAVAVLRVRARLARR